MTSNGSEAADDGSAPTQARTFEQHRKSMSTYLGRIAAISWLVAIIRISIGSVLVVGAVFLLVVGFLSSVGLLSAFVNPASPFRSPSVLPWLIAGFAGGFVGALLYRVGLGMVTLSGSEVRSISSRKPVLYLRSFSDDGIFMSLRKLPVPPNAGIDLYYFFDLLRIETFEQVVVRQFRKLGPVLAISRPNQKLPPSGAHRFLVVGKGTEWQNRVRADRRVPGDCLDRRGKPRR